MSLGPRKGQQRTPRSPVSILTAKRAPLFTATYIPEPPLEFGNHGHEFDPRVGLGIHGPVDRKDPTRRAPIRLGLIGTGPLIDKFRAWMSRCQGEAKPVRRYRSRGETVVQR